MARYVVFVIVLLFGIGIGDLSDPDPEVEYKVIHDTETVTETVLKEVPSPAPAECATLVKLSRQYAKAASRYDQTTAEVLGIMSRLRIAVAGGDSNAATALQNELTRIEARTIGAAEILGANQQPFDEAAAACAGEEE